MNRNRNWNREVKAKAIAEKERLLRWLRNWILNRVPILPTWKLLKITPICGAIKFKIDIRQDIAFRWETRMLNHLMSLAKTRIKFKIMKLYFWKILHRIMKKSMKQLKVKLLKICLQWSPQITINKIEFLAVLYLLNQMDKNKCFRKAISSVKSTINIYKIRKNHLIITIFTGLNNWTTLYSLPIHNNTQIQIRKWYL